MHSYHVQACDGGTRHHIPGTRYAYLSRSARAPMMLIADARIASSYDIKQCGR